MELPLNNGLASGEAIDGARNGARNKARNGATDDPANRRLNEAAEAFEGAFLKILLKSMRSTIPEGGLFDRQQMEQFEEMRDGALADSLSARSATGIAEMVVRQLGGVPDGPPAMDFQEKGTISMQVTSANGPKAPSAADQQSRQAFVEKLLPAARQAAKALGIEPAVLVAQAALETGWGQHIPKARNAPSSNNLFGIKAGGSWKGPVSENTTNEFIGGKMRNVVASFRAYSSAAESLKDYVQLITKSPRYQQALDSTSSSDYLRSLQRGGYATDPNYAEKIESIMASRELRSLDD